MSSKIEKLHERLVEIERRIPTRMSQLRNDSKFVTSWSIGSGKLKFYVAGEKIAEFGANQTKDLSVNLDAIRFQENLNL